MKRTLLYLCVFLFSGNLFAQFGTFDATFNQGNYLQVVQYASYPKIISTGNETALVHQNVGVYQPGPPYGASDGAIASLTNNTSGNASVTALHTVPFFDQFSNVSDMFPTTGNKIVIIGEKQEGQGSFQNIFVARIDATTGAVDPTFNSGNHVIIENTNVNYTARKVWVLSDNKILMAGTENSSFYLRKFNADGTPDNTFGTGGTQLFTVLGSSSKVLFDMKVLSSGKILIAGSDTENVPFGKGGSINVMRAIVAQLNTDGTLDTSFGDAGVQKFQFGEYSAESHVQSIDVASDGSIVVTGNGYYNVGGNTWRPRGAFTKLNSAGQLAAGFADPFIYSVDYSYLTKCRILANGKTLVSGSRSDANYTGYGLFLLFNADGTIDTSVGSDDFVVLSETGLFGTGVHVDDFDIQPDGKVIYVYSSSASYQAVVRAGRMLMASTSGLHESNAEILVDVYPNPSSDVITISASSSTSAEITSSNGSTLANLKLNGETTVDVSTYAPGVYFIRTAEGQTVKFIKQ